MSTHSLIIQTSSSPMNGSPIARHQSPKSGLKSVCFVRRAEAEKRCSPPPEERPSSWRCVSCGVPGRASSTTGRMFLWTSSMGPGRWEILSLRSSASLALLSCSCLAWRDGSADVSAGGGTRRSGPGPPVSLGRDTEGHPFGRRTRNGRVRSNAKRPLPLLLYILV